MHDAQVRAGLFVRFFRFFLVLPDDEARVLEPLAALVLASAREHASQVFDAEHAHTDVMLALRDAFSTAQRQVDELSDRLDKQARHEKARRRPAPEREEG